jgi:hypothetical protein
MLLSSVANSEFRIALSKHGQPPDCVPQHTDYAPGHGHILYVLRYYYAGMDF